MAISSPNFLCVCVCACACARASLPPPPGSVFGEDFDPVALVPLSTSPAPRGGAAILSRCNFGVFNEAVRLTDRNPACTLYFVGVSKRTHANAHANTHIPDNTFALWKSQSRSQKARAERLRRRFFPPSHTDNECIIHELIFHFYLIPNPLLFFFLLFIIIQLCTAGKCSRNLHFTAFCSTNYACGNKFLNLESPRLCTYIHTHTHACTHANAHANTHTHTNAYALTNGLHMAVKNRP